MITKHMIVPLGWGVGWACAVAGVVGLVGECRAQQLPRLELSLVLRDVAANSTLTDIQTGGEVPGVAGQTYRVELRYRIAMDPFGTRYSRGLASATLRVAISGSTSPLRRARLSAGQDDPAVSGPISTGAANPDTSGPGPGTTGLIGVFRGGLTTDTDFANGRPLPAGNGVEILPLSLSAPGHPSWRGSIVLPPGPDSNPATWGVFAFEFISDGGFALITASAVPDPTDGRHFSYFVRTGTTNNPVPQPGFDSTVANLTFIPAPTVLSGGALLAPLLLRRRRRY